MKLFGTMEVVNNSLYIGDVSTLSLAEKYDTPLIVIDEKLVRTNCKRYIEAFNVGGGKNKVAYAGKAFLPLSMCRIVNEEKLCLDVVSGGELYTALKSGFPSDKIYFHGNNKTLDEIEMGVKNDIGRFVVDNLNELDEINEVAKRQSKIQKVILRITPGIEAHTHEYIKTGQIDSKFGFTLLGDITMKAVEKATTLSNVKFVGLHCHIGSQIFETAPYEDEVDIMLNLVKDIEEKLKIQVEELDLGGGFGIYYVKGDKPRKIEEICSAILSRAKATAQKLDMILPALIIEPGRSIIGNGGSTLYTVGSIKKIPDVRTYVAVDGGMSDNVRPALYKAEYECALCSKMESDAVEKITVCGKCCESGDILIHNTLIPKAETGDILVVATTGAYGYSMANNYNKIRKPAVVLVSDGNSKLICKRQSYEDLIIDEI
jgi:diaminopimelate decarboxylase